MNLEGEAIHMAWAAWKSIDQGIVALSRDWKGRKRPKFWWGKDKLSLKSVERLDPLEYGWQAGYYGDKTHIHFICKAERFRDTILYVGGSFSGWAQAVDNEKWKMSLTEIEGQSCYHLKVRRDQLPKDQPAYFKFITENRVWLDVPEDAPNLQTDNFGFHNYLFNPKRTGKHLFGIRFPLPLNQSKSRKVYFESTDGKVDGILVRPGVFLKSMETDEPLGAWIKDGRTYFSLFAPRARRVQLFLFDDLDSDEPPPLDLELRDNMLWQIEVEGEWSNCYYYYTVAGEQTEDGAFFNEHVKVVDPYAKAMVGPLGPGIIPDEQRLVPAGTPFVPPAWHDLVIAEAHVRDLTANAPIQMGIEERDGFTGLEKWVEAESFYLSKLGVNAVELQPVHIFDEQTPDKYAWGYMPLNYFSPASQYSMEPKKGSGIEEFKRVVQAFHKRGMAVLLDVVYNHVGEPNFLQYLDKSYYFLLTRDGHYENYSGCGNTIDANAPMARRLILDSLIHWIEVYDVDGFRFDLGELIGKETLAWLENKLKAVKPGIVLIAEPWSFRGHIGESLKETGFASWNDGYREVVRRYIMGEASGKELRYFMKGSFPHWSRFPAQTVNYVDSHDDRCWIDKITQNAHHNGSWPTATDRRRTHLMISVLMSSLGVPMLSSGIDFLKSKGGVNNTYLRGDLNAIPYSRQMEYPATVEYVKNWIQFRCSELGKYLRLDAFPSEGYIKDIEKSAAYGICYNADFSKGDDQVLFAVNSSFEWQTLDLNEVSTVAWQQIADHERFDAQGIAEPVFSIMDSLLKLPPLSCGLWLGRASRGL